MTNFTSLPPGAMIREYKILSVLGHGAFGITYLAIDKNLNKKVAIKEYFPNVLVARNQYYEVLPKSHGDAEDYFYGLKQFINEAKTLASFDHPNIIKVLSYFELNKTAYFVMEYSPGRSLETALKEMEGAGEKITQDEVRQLTEPLMDALAVMHKANILHRDIKPANIYIRDDNSQPVLLDFGAARHSLGKHSRSISTILTPGYAPVEQYQTSAEHQGPWTDIYGLAATMYRVITGRLPAEAVSRFNNIQDEGKDSLLSIYKAARGSFDKNFLSALMYGLNIEKNQRPKSIHEWKAAFNSKGIEPKISTLIGTQSQESTGKQFNVYKHPTLGFKAVKQGFSWGMLVAGVLTMASLIFILIPIVWSSIRRMWIHSALLLGFFFMIALTIGILMDSLSEEEISTIRITLSIISGVAIGLIYGFKGNTWYSNSLLNKGYKLLQTVPSKNSEMAIALVVKKS